MSRHASYPPAASDSYDIIVGIDLAETGFNALHEALRMAHARPDVKIHVVHCVPSPKDADAKVNGLTHAEVVAKYVRDSAKGLTDVHPTDVNVHVRIGDPVKALIHMAIEIDAEVIVVGTRGRRGLTKLALGSVATALIERAPCPVFVARPKEYDTVQKDEIEPLCPDCATIRASTNGETQWCEYHARPHVRFHTYGYVETCRVGGHDPGIIASGGG